ncbi:Rrf2 family transcriptional regulator [Massilia sp. RP-1-19]|uniref:Rrf2 family transcriptional regulator n=1 Tax=Massilia polaris TaxID=2728846 RepID=A0A848HG25_9BURK|nr:Rrf2 family transcriptional regulator [Massilia polaris]NML60154.1 Rrf2 family transcriptional regulator [Massilia polaris]
MRLTTFTDYTLRTLIHLGMHRDRLVTIQEIADLHAISKNHLMKVVYQLGLAGVVETLRGRNGGLRLKLEPEQINIGAIVRASETDFYMAECFNPAGSSCGLSGGCRLQDVLVDATDAYLAVLDNQTLASVLPRPRPDAVPVQFYTKPATRQVA